jgi:hypothetical protein
MRVAQTVPDDTLPVRGYARRTLECSECGEIEQRLIFAGDTALSETEAATESQVDAGGTEGEPQASTDEALTARWAQAVEKVRMRQSTLALQAAAQRAAVTVADEHPTHSGKFNRLWDDLAAPQPPVLAPSPASNDDDVTAKSARPIPDMALTAQTTPLAPTGLPPRWSAIVDAGQSLRKSAHALVAGAMARLRAAVPRRAQRERHDAILQIDTDALRVMPPPRRKLPRKR